MKQYISRILSAVAMSAMFILLPTVLMAQPDPCVDPADPACVPIDGGLSFLIAAGVGYGVKKVRDSRKKLQTEQGVI